MHANIEPKNDEIIIATAIDKGYLMQLCVMLYSLFENNKSENINLFVLSGSLDKQDEDQINWVAQKFERKISYLKFDDSIFNKYHISKHISHATYYRILIPTLFQPDIEKVLYLDSDLIVNANLNELWKTKIKGKAVAAASGPFFSGFELLNLPEKAFYFNAGVLLMNLKYWRKNDTHNKVLAFLDENTDKLPNWDQDALNAILYPDVQEVAIEWNIQTLMFLKKKEYQKIDKMHKIYMENPKIVHFTGKSKPWHYADAHPYKYLFTKYLKLSGIAYKYPDKGLLSLIKRIAVKILPWSLFEKYIKIKN